MEPIPASSGRSPDLIANQRSRDGVSSAAVALGELPPSPNVEDAATALDTGGSAPLSDGPHRTSTMRPSETTGAPLLAVILSELERLDESLKREIAKQLGAYLGDDRERLLDASEKAEQLRLNPETLVRMARAGRVPGAKKVGRAWRFPADVTDVLPVGLEAVVSGLKPGRLDDRPGHAAPRSRRSGPRVGMIEMRADA